MSTALYTAIFVLIIHGVVCPPVIPWYDSYGPNQLFTDEGTSVRSVSGADYFSDVIANTCAAVCNWMDRVCECCNSFTFRPSDGTCYLKKRDANANQNLKQSQYGWQSYKYWGQVTAFPPNDKYTGGLLDTAEGAPVNMDIGLGYTHSYTSVGPNQLAVSEGESIQTAEGFDYLSESSPKTCSEECDKVSDCDSFSYNPNQNSGICYLKKSLGEKKYETIESASGWSTYWKETDFQTWTKCFCTCQNTWACILCGQVWPGGVCDAY